VGLATVSVRRSSTRSPDLTRRRRRDRAVEDSQRRRPGRLIVVSGPSGVGKSTVVSALHELQPFFFSVSATTRSRRPGEVDGVDYRFVTEHEFDDLRASGELLEWAEYGGYRYGTPRTPVLAQLEMGNDVLLDIEVNGAMQVKAAFPKAITMFVAPPSMDTLEQRLRGRGDTDPDQVDVRLRIAGWQMTEAKDTFDHVVINEEVEDTVAQILRILAASPTRADS
jgi:guanylate kinase